MPTFLTEFHDPEEGRLIGPYLVATSLEAAEEIAKHIIMEADGCPLTVLGELAESIPTGLNMARVRQIQHEVRAEVEAIIDRGIGRRSAAIAIEADEWKKIWEDE